MKKNCQRFRLCRTISRSSSENGKERQQQLLSSRSEAAEIIKTRKKVENRLAKTLKETTAEVTRLREKARTDISQEREEALSSVKMKWQIFLFKLQPKF